MTVLQTITLKCVFGIRFKSQFLIYIYIYTYKFKMFTSAIYIPLIYYPSPRIVFADNIYNQNFNARKLIRNAIYKRERD